MTARFSGKIAACLGKGRAVIDRADSNEGCNSTCLGRACRHR